MLHVGDRVCFPQLDLKFFITQHALYLIYQEHYFVFFWHTQMMWHVQSTHMLSKR
jgi:hypothetical protein